MKIFGLTGGIACGKSTVSALLTGHGARVIDADQIARDVVLPGKPAYKDIVAAFGEGVLAPDGTLNRPALGKIVFADEKARARLNAITHPRIAQETAQRIQAERAAGTQILIYDAALLVETGGYKMYEALIVVSARPEVQMERLIARDGISEEEARQKIAAQLPLEEKEAVADYVIDNSGTLEELKTRVDALWALLAERAGL
ncbi:MAG: dephospho-CoA kinase [Chrysiogenetes bacterium]|nr:dephospho-CoA kinase [Chrysiogenetes bacterium]